VTFTEVLLLTTGGLFAGVLNTLAGGGSLLTVPLLVMVGLPGNVANGSNRVGVLVQSAVAAWRFRAEGVSGFRTALPLLWPIGLGSVTGAYLVSQLADRTFERLFGIVMVVLLVPLLRRSPRNAETHRQERRSPGWVSFVVFFAIGLYGGSFQAGVGIALIFALAYAGDDLVRANSVKVVIVAALTLIALPIFVVQDQIEWLPGLVMGCGFAAGGALGTRLAIRGGEKLIRPVFAACVLALAARMVGLF
jgi:uncharacterized membrane protein YfcA